jgi:alpha-L-rhamnosidase
MKKIHLLPALLLIMGSISAAAAPVAAGLRCEHNINPLGIDVETPRFSWRMDDPEHTHGQRQTAYRILVASSTSMLAVGKADVWDSGVVQSSESHLVPYAGKKLQSGGDYYWTVQVYDMKRVPSEWSAAARFSVGLLSRLDWKGQWIKHPSAAEERHIWFRKHLNIDGKPSATAFAYVASLGYHELYVNGKKADERVLAPVISRIDRRTVYVTYDIAPLLQEGDNVVAVWYAAGWTRNDYFNKLIGQGLLVQLNGRTADGKDFTLCSDATWKTEESCSRNTGEYKFWDMGGELLDGRRYITDKSRDWSTTAFDDSAWHNAQTTKPQQGGKDSLIISAQMCDASRILESLSAVSISDSVPGEWKVDLGKSFTGFVEASFDDLHAGDTVIIQVSNRRTTSEEFKQKLYYIARGEKGETFVNRFNFVSGRYVTLSGLRRPPRLSEVKGHAVSSAGKRTGYFSSSNRLFNQIYEADRRTYEMCHTEGVVVDCPNRERLGYGMEGAYMTTWGLGLPCFASAAYYVKNVRDWSDVQREDGRMNYVAPQVSDMWGNSMAGAASMNIAYELYHAYGDIQPLEMAREAGSKWLDFLFENLDDDGLVKDYDGRHGFFLGEWLLPKHIQEFNEDPKAVFFNNCAFAMALDLYINICNILGRENETAPYRERLQKLRDAIHRRYYNQETNAYLDGDQVRTAFALFAGIVPDKMQEIALQRLENDMTGDHPYFNIGSFVRYPYYHVLFAHRRFTNIIHDIMAKRTWPGYGYFISQGETTWPETWEINEDTNSSIIHTGNTGISAWFIKSLAGIEPSKTGGAGYRSITIRPNLPDRLDRVKAGIETPYGMVESAWQREQKGITFQVSIPANTSATIILPNGKSYSVGAGKYSYTIPPGKTTAMN